MSDNEPDAGVVLNDEDFEELDADAVAQRLSCTIGEVIEHVNTGRLAAYRLGDKVWFLAADVDALS
ncbi:MAG: hypothetical protein V3V01_04835 [Acidimicrobiales bacterium]